MKKKIIVALTIIVVLAVIIGLFIVNKLYTRYELGDYGVSLKAINSYQKIEDDAQLLLLYNFAKDITINVKELEGDFWSKDDIDTINDEYIRLISAIDYDCNIFDVKKEKKKIDFKEVGMVELQADRVSKKFKLITILTHKSNGFLAIEIFGDPEVMDNNSKEIENIINSIKFSENKHDYSLDVKSGDVK